MKTLLVILLILVSTLFCDAAFTAQEQPAAASASSTPAQAAAPQSSQRIITAYTLPPDLYKKAHDLGGIYFRLSLLGFVYGLVTLRWRLSAKYRDWAERASAKRFPQAFVFSVPLILTIAILELPERLYGHHISYAYGISVQDWGSWFWDWTKSQILSVTLAVVLIWILYGVIRRSPRRWWFYFWLVSLPITVVLVFIQPLIVDAFQGKDPASTASF
jgi:hypothetical protein